MDTVPPPLHECIYQDRPEMVEWLLDHGAGIERREQDYGSTPLRTAVVMRRERIVPISLGPVRAQLIRKGMIYSPAYGELAFTVPLFDGFMKRALPSF